ncbi:hypothetical protein BDW59DRAFT_157519 [Aspergillus cavernicola]|uniref:Cytochrome P450 n=1 Tax=Aspergillus cavernicola TaxID=176166 RepID=A0ABR4IWD6_9EURO
MKAGKTVPEFGDNHELQERLLSIFENHDVLDPRDNPLNLILPGFETLWRIVLRFFMVLKTHGHEHWKETMISFAQGPASKQFKLRSDKDDISAEFLVKEALRLYPPTPRIRRAFQFPGSHQQQNTIIADIEACQTDPGNWGDDALEFNPARWRSLTSEQRNSFLAFGGAPFQCPASQDFGPRVIGLFVGILLDEIGDGWILGSDDVDEQRELDSGRRLRNDRDSYAGVYLVERVEE